MKSIEPLLEETQEAAAHPNGWVYRIAGSYGPGEAVPPEAIVGAWKVDARGCIVGAFVPNPKFILAILSDKGPSRTNISDNGI